MEKGYTGYNGRIDKRSTGIGLYLCKKVMDKLHHQLRIDSEDGKGTKYENKDVVSKLVEDDGGNMTIYAQWKKKKKLCLKVSSNSYLKSLINPAAEALAKNWFGKNNNTLVENMMNKSDKDCVQVWSVSREGISRTR